MLLLLLSLALLHLNNGLTLEFGGLATDLDVLVGRLVGEWVEVRAKE